MKIYSGYSIGLIFVIFSCASKNDYRVAAHLTPQQQDDLMWKIIRYAARAPEGLTYEERFYPGYDTFYRSQAALHKFDAYYMKRHQHYFLISRKAPSLMDKRVAIGGRFVLDGEGKLEEYEEVFRTWKMVPDTLARRSLLLFDKMVKGEDLSSFETRNSHGVEYIEFPDEHTYFDKQNRQWKVKQE